MATLYTQIYDVFLSKISDYSYISLNQADLEQQLFSFLRSSIPKFKRAKIDLSNRSDNQFNDDLTDEEIEILSTLMLVEYLKPVIINSKLYKQTMTDKEFRVYSQANHIRELKDLYQEIKKEANKLMTDYSYNEIDFAQDARRVNSYDTE